MVVMVVLLVSVAAIVILRGPFGRAFAKRIEGSAGTDEATQHRIEELEARSHQFDDLQARLAEVEERLDFAERLLAREPAKPQLESGR